MKIAQLFGVKTNSSQQRGCCHKRNDGTGCKAHPQTGSPYCFFHDPTLQNKRRAASRSGGAGNRKPARTLRLPPNPLQTASQIADFLRQTMNQLGQGEVDILRAATGIGYLTTVLLQVMGKEISDEERARRSAATDSFLKSVFSDPAAAAETEEEAEAEVDSPEQQRAKLAALLFADDSSLPENVKFEIRSKTKPEPRNAPQPHDPQINTRQINDRQRDDRQRDERPIDKQKPNGGKTDHPAAFGPFSPTRELDPEEKTSSHAPARGGQGTDSSVPPKPLKTRALAPEVVLPREERVVDKSESVDKIPEPFTSSPVSPPARQDEVKPDAVRQDQSFSGIPGLQPRHIGYMQFATLTGTAQWKRRRNPYFLTGTAAQAAEMRAEAARLKRTRR